MTTASAKLLRQVHHLVEVHGSAGLPDRQLLQRFAAERDEAAFVQLVRRHGPMVLGVRRRVLDHEQDAEDAFQAAFLVLARRAGAIRQSDVGGFLYRVAYRLAIRARAAAARRKQRDRAAGAARLAAPISPGPARLAGPTSGDPLRDVTWREVRQVVDEELQRLPEALRSAVVLCYLEGKTQEEAARLLECSKSTLRRRLDQGRERLRRRLLARGLAPAAALTAALFAEEAAPAAVSPALVGVATRTVLATTVSPAVAALAAGATRAVFLTKTRIATLMLLAAGLFAAGAGVLRHQTLAAQQTKTAPVRVPAVKAAARPPAADDKDSIAYSGRVLGPDGRPVPGAKLYLTPAVGYLERPSPSPAYATTGRDGRFTCTAPKARFGEQATVVTAAPSPSPLPPRGRGEGEGAANHGPGWVEVAADGKRDDLTLRLVDDLPITGQIVDLEAKPVAGATLTLLQINAAANEDPGPWLEAVKGKAGLRGEFEFEQRYLPRFTVALSPKATTDAAGRFRLRGIGRNRLVRVQLDGPTIASQQMYILTRPGKTIKVPLIDADLASGTAGVATVCHPVSFRHVAGPTRPVVGVIRDKDTGQPLPGVTVRSYRLANNSFDGPYLVRTRTDDKGCYRLVGLPKGKGNKVLVIPADDQPYLVAGAEVPDPPGFEPVTIHFRLKRGLWIAGRLTDKATGRPAPGEVYYLARIGNRFVRDCEGYEPLESLPTSKVRKDGTFRVVGLPGLGLLAVRSGGPYLEATERDDAEGARDTVAQTTPIRVSTEGFVALSRIDPPQGVETFRRDVTLDPGQNLTGMVLGPDGEPLAGARTYRLAGLGWERSPLKTASFTVRAFNPHRPRPVLFLHPQKRLAGILELPADRTAPIRVRTRPSAAVTGRLVDADGQPRANLELLLGIRDRSLDTWISYSPDRIRTDRDGRFRIEALVPGQRYFLFDGRSGEAYFGSVWWFLGGSLRAGQTKDLGDVRLKRANE